MSQDLQLCQKLKISSSPRNTDHTIFEWFWPLYVEAFEDLQKGKEEDMFIAG